MNIDSPLHLKKQPNMEYYTKQYGNIHAYKLDEIYTNVVTKHKWSILKCIDLFEELLDECYEEITIVDNEYVRLDIQSKIKSIKCYIEFLESSLR